MTPPLCLPPGGQVHIALPLRRMNKKKTNTFEYSDEGIGQACDWLNQVYTENADLFKTVPI